MHLVTVKYEFTLNEIVEKYQENLKTKDLKEFYFQGENYKRLCVGYINDGGFFELRTFEEEKGIVRENNWHRTALPFSTKSFNQKYRIIESLHELFK